ncbi:cytidine deaminase-like isoform X2 [Frankliniella occidentalis]|uniref:Cytidine deaminase n=1 Tax=Frankliniella occidentalis TaxID=133901 RepID=A0A6J1T1N7_FRAOC|nr:cytidine deaminase-like isoform X2 [Frankliniella occidentalis]
MADSRQRSAGKIVPFSAIEPDVQELIRKGVEVRERSYSPYSKFKVGSAILCADNTVVTGCNVENGAHGSICAERSAVVKAVSEGKREFQKVVVVADKLENQFTAPCGSCRQFIIEFGTGTEIFLSPPDMSEVLVTSIKEILPLHFTLTD